MTKTTEPASSSAPFFTLGRITLALSLLLTLLGALIILFIPPISPPATVTAVVASRALPPYTHIIADDVSLTDVPEATNVFTDTTQVIGRLTIAAVAQDAPLVITQTLALPPDVWLMTLPISPTLARLTPGDTLLLFAVDQAPITVTLLARGEGSIDVAAPANEGPRLADWLAADRRIIVLRPLAP
ncbi:MAG: hypothetical protein GXP37_10715 [Chloroflexi bacterium]|nr:hypothetical protein [Chloroflexota bacterium]